MKKIKIQQAILFIVIVGIVTAYFVFLKSQTQSPVVIPVSPGGTQVTDIGPTIDEELNVPTDAKLNEPKVEVYDDQGEEKMRVELTWEIDESENEAFALYKIYRSTDSNFEKSVTIPIVEIFKKERRKHFDLVSETGTYYYRIVVIDKSDLRADSNIVIAKP